VEPKKVSSAFLFVSNFSLFLNQALRWSEAA